MPATSYTDPATVWAAYALQGRTDESGSAVDDLNGEDMRIVLEAFTAGVLSTDAFQVREDSPAPGMTVRVGSGAAKSDVAILEGTEAGQGKYAVRLGDGVTDVTVPAADVSNPRIDEVYAVVQDDIYDSNGGNVVPRIGYRRGDAASNPSAPGPDGSWTAYLLLASIDVAAGVTEIDADDITDERVFARVAVPPEDSSIGTTHLVDDAVTTAKIDDDAVTAAKIAAGAVADFIKTDLGTDTGFRSLTTSFVDQAAVTFNKPSSWNTYSMVAWGGIVAATNSPAAASLEARAEIGGVNGAVMQVPHSGLQADLPLTTSAAHRVSSTSASNITIALAARRAAGEVTHRGSWIAYMAIRLT